MGYVDFTEELKYLGSPIKPSLTYDADVTKRLKAASAAFGALKGAFRNRHLDYKAKAAPAWPWSLASSSAARRCGA